MPYRPAPILAIIALVGTLGVSSPADARSNPAEKPEVAEETGVAAFVERCHDRRWEAYEELNRRRRRDEKVSPKIRGYALLGEAIELCWRASSEVKEPAEAAELAALVYLDKVRLLVFEGTREDQRKVLTEGISVVSGLHHDRSPALLELLDQSAYAEWGAGNRRYGDRLLRQAIEIAREAHGSKSPWVADKLTALASLYSPKDYRGTTPSSWHDPQKAETLLLEALGIHLEQEDPFAHESYGHTLLFLETLYRATGRNEKADALSDEAIEALDETSRRATEARRKEREARQQASAAAETAADEPAPVGEGDG